jgi:hypothetical protein
VIFYSVAFFDIGHAPADHGNRRTDLQGYAAWEIHPVMKLEARYFDGQLQDARATPPELLTLFPAPDQLAPSPGVAP